MEESRHVEYFYRMVRAMMVEVDVDDDSPGAVL